MSETPPSTVDHALAKAKKLQYWHIVSTIFIVAAMGAVMGQSQTMKTAWIEDMLGLVPPIAFLVALRLERKSPSRRFPFGFDRANGLGFLVSAVALASVGLVLLWDAIMTLVAAQHATVGSIRMLGQEFWLGWLMLAVQAIAILPPLIIGRMELPLAKTLSDKLLHTDALMNKANWMTGAAGMAGIMGLGMGWWWADSVAAAIISLDIIHDGVTALRSATAELADGTPRALEGNDISEDAKKMERLLASRFPGADIKLRETGRLIRAEVHGAFPPENYSRRAHWPGDDENFWRLAQISFVPPETAQVPGKQD